MKGNREGERTFGWVHTVGNVANVTPECHQSEWGLTIGDPRGTSGTKRWFKLAVWENSQKRFVFGRKSYSWSRCQRWCSFGRLCTFREKPGNAHMWHKLGISGTLFLFNIMQMHSGCSKYCLLYLKQTNSFICSVAEHRGRDLKVAATERKGFPGLWRETCNTFTSLSNWKDTGMTRLYKPSTHPG